MISSKKIKEFSLTCTFLIFIIGFLNSCGDSVNETLTDEDITGTVNTQKLLGTPFEGLENGDNFTDNYFLCDIFKTETIDSFPISIFTAFFNEYQESLIAEGVAIANKAIGFTVYELTDVWSDDVRVIYKVSDVSGAIGQTWAVDMYYNQKEVGERITRDWAIAIEEGKTSSKLIAHELGHATGILGHNLIDYDNNTTTELEENSIMEANLPHSPVYDDYNYMMNKQGQIMLDHLGEIGELDNDRCD